MRRLLHPDKQRKARGQTIRTLLDSGFPGTGGCCSGGRPSHGILVLGLARSSGLGRFSSRNRHGGPERRGSRRLVFLVLAAHGCSFSRRFLSVRPGNHLSTVSKSALHSPGPATPPGVLHPGFSALGDRCLAIGPIHEGPASSPPPRCLLGAALPRGTSCLATELPTHLAVGKKGKVSERKKVVKEKKVGEESSVAV